jgi:hypothetical protein
MYSKLGVVILSLHASLAAQGSRAESEEGHLRVDLSLGPSSVREEAAAILRSAGRPGGIVALSGCNEPSRIPIAASMGSSLASALDLLVALRPSYYWTSDQGVINVLPRGSLPSVMSVRVERFRWDATDSVHLAVSNLSQLGEVRRHLAAMGEAAGVEIGAGLQRPPRILDGVPEHRPAGRSYSVADIPLLKALNEVVASFGGSVWYYEERSCEGRITYSFSVR